MSAEDCIVIKEKGVLIRLKVIPNSSKNQIITEEEIIKLKVTAQPVENKANKAVIEYLSKFLKVAKTTISIIKGETSKEKTVFISNTDKDKQQKIKNILLGKND